MGPVRTQARAVPGVISLKICSRNRPGFLRRMRERGRARQPGKRASRGAVARLVTK